MRKYLVLPVVAVALLLGTLTASASTGSSTYYAGRSSQGQKLFFSVDQIAGSPKFDPFFTNMVTYCPATHRKFTIEYSFSGFEIPIKNGKFKFTLNDISDRFSWSGTVTPKKASGPESYQLAAFDSHNGLQDCATGAVTWKAPALVQGAPKAAAPAATYHVAVTRASNGTVHYTVTH
jgi:hypothetical protein